jgi:hypothetical protein
MTHRNTKNKWLSSGRDVRRLHFFEDKSMTNQNTQLVALDGNLAIAELMRALELLEVADDDAEHLDALDGEIEAHQQHGFYVPTREELMDTTGEFLVHLMMERE